MRLNQTQSRSAFSLVEVMTAVSLLGLLVGSLYSSWAAIARSTHSGKEAAANVQRERVALREVAESLGAAVLVADGEDRYQLIGDSLHGQSRLSLVQHLPGDRPGRNRQFFRRVTFSVEPSADGSEWQLVRREAPVIRALENPPPAPRVLARRVRHFRVEYLADTGRWQADWKTPDVLPRRARIRIGLGVGAETRVREVTLRAIGFAHGGTPPKRVVNAKQFEESGFPAEELKRHVFVIDKSGSMRRRDVGDQRMTVAKQALLNTLAGMEEDQEFYILFFNNSTDAMPVPQMLNATPGNVAVIKAWIESQKPSGGTSPSSALVQAFEQEPDVIWLLSDGEFSRRVHNLAGDLNANRAVRINTLGFGNKWYFGSRSLRQLAEEHGGAFTLVTP